MHQNVFGGWDPPGTTGELRTLDPIAKSRLRYRHAEPTYFCQFFDERVSRQTNESVK